MGCDLKRNESSGAERMAEWETLGEWLGSPPLLHEVDLDVVRERLSFVGRARSSLAALEADLLSEVARREGDAAAEEMLRREQKRSRAGARKAVKTAAQLEWAPTVAEKLASGAITPEAAGLILDAEGPVDHGVLLEAAEEEPEDRFRRTLKEHVNDRTSEQELTERRARQRRRRRASITEQPDGMFHLFAQFDPLVGNQVRAALVAKANALFRSEDSEDRSTPPQRFADALAQLICTNGDTNGHGNSGDCVSAGVELIVLADYDQVAERITNARLTDGTRLTEAETLAVACDAKILPGIFNKHTGDIVLGRSQRKVPKRLRKRLVARDRGCIGCGAHEQICEVHHIVPWAHGGETSYDNTCLLCWRCHQVRVHQHGEEVTRHRNGTYTLQPPGDRRARAVPQESEGTESEAPAVAGETTDHPEPRRHEPGHRRERRRPTGGHRRGPPDAPATSPSSPTLL